MESKKSLCSILIVLSVIFLTVSSVGCSKSKGQFDVLGQTTDGISTGISIASAHDIKNLVTNDEKLVIDYYDAYLWTVLYDEAGNIDYMIYIYEFEDEVQAQSMVEVREKQLAQNKSMSIISADCVENYVIVSLTDSSFDDVTREMLENNFSGLIVY